jgi:hypothetical protein
MTTDDRHCIARLRRRLERWELDHLRQHAADLRSQLDGAEMLISELRSMRTDAEQRADYWYDICRDLQADLRAELAVGITPDGDMGVVDPAGRPPTKHAKPVVKAAAKGRKP